MTLPCPRCAAPEIHDIAVVLARPDDVRTGLLAWASAIVGTFRIDGLAVRITRAGKFTVTWPEHRGHPTVIPVEPELFRQVEAAVIGGYTAAKAKAARRSL